VNLTQANRIRANRNPVSLNRVNRIRRAEANRTQAMPATAIPTAPATRDHPVAVIPARAIRAVATAANPIVRKVNRPARKATANRKVNRIPKIQAAIVTRYRAIRGQATRSQVTPVVAVLLLRVIPAKAKARATQSDSESQSESESDSQSRSESEPSSGDSSESRSSSDRPSYSESYSVPWSTSHSTSGSASIRKAIQAADRQADLTVIPRHQPAIREIHLPVTQMIRQQVIPQIHPPASVGSPERKPFR
jgi:hypothetical protein